MQVDEHRTTLGVSAVAAFRAALASTATEALTDADRIALVAELERLKGGAAATQARLTAGFAASQGAPLDPTADDPDLWRPVGSEVGLARHESPAQGDRLVRFALLLTGDLPRTLRALERGMISEWTARIVADAAAHLHPGQRHELDERIGPDLHRLSSRQARVAAARIVADIDAEAVHRRMRAARQGRRVSMRVVADGMAYLSILGPATEVAGAHAALRRHADATIAGRVATETATGRDGTTRGVGAIMSDTALQRLSGRAPTEAQPVTVNIVMTDRALLGWGDPERSSQEPALIPGLGPVPADVARELLADPQVEAFYRRLFTSPDGRDLVGMDARSRIFPQGLRTMIVLRDQRCRTPFCDAPITQIDHVRPHRERGPTSYRNGMGLCRRCNLTKETPGYRAEVRATRRAHTVDLTTPTGQRVTSLAPPLLGWGWRAPPDAPASAGFVESSIWLADPSRSVVYAPADEAPPDPLTESPHSRAESPAERAVRLALAA